MGTEWGRTPFLKRVEVLSRQVPEWRGGVKRRGQVLPRAPIPVIAAFRYTARRVDRTIGGRFGIN